MVKESAAQKNKRRREKRAGPVSVSIPNHLAAPLFPHPDGNPEPLTVAIASVRTAPPPASVSWADDTAETFHLPPSLPPVTAHPWRTIRCRNHRVRPQRPERRPFPQSLPKILSLQHLPSPLLPAVHSNLALACARELPDVYASFEEILEIAGGPPEDREDLLGALPPDQLVFLSTLAVIAALDRTFQQFLYPVIAHFTDRWVAHLRQDSFG
ncbi:hypothetical protein B0H14DRAFT_2860829 [Mycena olivaceomarginata]|nr:hypothetical protein B0H14DRAFT_2860829 [Mycena olivaceomarginata]